MDCNISEQKFYKLKGKPWSIIDWPSYESERSPPDIGYESKKSSKEYMENLLPSSMRHLYGIMPALETLAVARCPACSYICKAQCLPSHYKCDRNNNIVCRTSDLILINGEPKDKALGPFYEIIWERPLAKITHVAEQSKITHIPKEKETKSHNSRYHGTYVDTERNSHSKNKSSSHSSSSSRDRDKSSKSSSTHKSSSSSSKSRSGHSHKKDKHKSSSGSSSSHSKRRDEKSSGEVDGSSSKSKSSSSKDKHDRTSSKSRSDKSSSKDRSDKSSKDRSEKSSSSKDRSEKSSSKDKSDKHSSRDRSEKSSSSWSSKSSKSGTKVNPSQGSYTLSIPSFDTGQNETVESILFSNSVIGGPQSQVMKIIATSTGSDKSKGDKTEYEQLKFYADSTDRRSKSGTDTERHDTSTGTGNSPNFKIPLKSKTNTSSLSKGKPSLKPLEICVSVKPPSKSPTGNSIRVSGVENSRSSSLTAATNGSDIPDGKLHDSKSKLASVPSPASTSNFKVLLQGKSGSSTVTQSYDSTKKIKSLSKPSEKAPVKPPFKSSTSITPVEVKTIGLTETDELQKQNAAPKPATVTHLKKKKKKKEKDVPRKIIPLKERSFNPDLHCGVHVAGDSRPCTRSLTCKTHSIALRRAVVGRSNPFDTLLQAHRKARDEEKNAKSETIEDKIKFKKVISNGADSVLTNSTIEVVRETSNNNSVLSSADKIKMSSSLSMPAMANSDGMPRLLTHRVDAKVDDVNSQTFSLGRSKYAGIQPSQDLIAGVNPQITNSVVQQSSCTNNSTLKHFLETNSSWPEGSSEPNSQNNIVGQTDTVRRLANPENTNVGWSEAVWDNPPDHDSDVEIISTQISNNLEETWRRSVPPATEKEPRTASELFQARYKQNSRTLGSSSSNFGSNRDKTTPVFKYLTPACTIGHANWASIYDQNVTHLRDQLAEFARTCGCYPGQDPDPSLFTNVLTDIHLGTPTDGECLFDLPMESTENALEYIPHYSPPRRGTNIGLLRRRRNTLGQHNSECDVNQEGTKKSTIDLVYDKKPEETGNETLFVDLRVSPYVDGNTTDINNLNSTATSRKRPPQTATFPVPTKRPNNDPKHPLDKRPDSVATVPLQMQNFQDIPTVSNTAVNNNLKNIPGDGLLFLNKQQTLRQVQADEFDQISRTESGSIVSNSKSETSTDPPCLDDNRDTNFFSGTNSHNGAILEFLSSLLDDPVDTSESLADLKPNCFSYQHMIRRIENSKDNKVELFNVPQPETLVNENEFGRERNPVINITATFPEYCDVLYASNPFQDLNQESSAREGWATSRVFLPDERAQTEVHSATQALAVRTLKSIVEKPFDASDMFFDSSTWFPDAYDHTTMIPK